MLFSFVKKHYIIISILAVALILRLVGVFYGYPLSLVYDETPGLAAALKMIGTQTLRANAFQYYYPAGLAYIYLPFLILYLSLTRIIGIFGSVEEIKQAVLLNLGAFVPVVRIVSVLLGTASVWLVYRISQKLFNNKAISLIAAWFLAISFFYVANSHYGQTWIAQTFFILLVLLWSLCFLNKEKISLKDYLAAGLLVGLAFSINFVGILSYFWFLLAHFLKNKGRKFSKIFITSGRFWFVNIVILLAIGLIYYLNPFGLNNYFGRIFSQSAEVNSYSLLSLASLKILFSYLKNGFLVEPVLFALALPSAVFVWRKNKIAFYFLALWLILYFFLLAPLTNPMVRYLLPTAPLLAILSAALLYYSWQKFSSRPKVLIILVILVSLPSLVFSILYDLRMTKNDTRVLAYHWIKENIKSGAVINNVSLGVELPLVEDKAIVELIKTKLPDLYSTSRKYLSSLPDGNYPVPNYALVNYDDLLPDVPKFDYLILADFDKNKLREKAAPFIATGKIVKIFYPLSAPENQNRFWPGRDELQVPFNDYQFQPADLFKFYPAYGLYIEIYEFKK